MQVVRPQHWGRTTLNPLVQGSTPWRPNWENSHLLPCVSEVRQLPVSVDDLQDAAGKSGLGGEADPHGCQRAAARPTLCAMGDDLAGRLRDVYRDLHTHPELSFQEHRTAGIAAGWLKDLGFEVIEGIATTGVAGVLRNGDGPTVLLRADMDALPVREATGLAHASGVDGVMHACGHDMHVTCLLGAASELAALRADWSGTVVAVFQPAEELPKVPHPWSPTGCSSGCRGRMSFSAST